MKHTILMNVRNHAGVMSHVVGLFARRGYNIDSIAVGTRENAEVSVISIIVEGSEKTIAQINNQLSKLVDVISVKDFHYHESVNRELSLIRVRFNKDNRAELLELINVFRANIEDMTQDTVIVEMAGVSHKVNALIASLTEKWEIIEMARTGEIALPYQKI